jgi:large repetitive protein
LLLKFASATAYFASNPYLPFTMKTNPISYIGIIIITLLFNTAKAQNFGISASAVWLSDCTQSNYFNTTGAIGPAANVFNNTNLGVHTQNSGTLILRGAQLRTFKDPLASNVCNVRMLYRIYLQSGVPGAFSSMDIPLLESCGGATFPSGGACALGDQKFDLVVADGTTVPYSPVNLTSFAPGNYVLEVYYEATGSFTSTTQCNDLVTLNNGGSNYKAFFTIQSPTLFSTNPTTCNGTDGSIIISGLAPGATYQLTYDDDGVTVGPSSITANASGQYTITGLNKGLYSNISLQINGCSTDLFTGVILSDPIFMPTFTSIPPFCAGTTPPTLPAVSNNGISGTWSPAVIDNQNSGVYTFTPNGGQCSMPRTISVTVTPRSVPTFAFGTTLTICGSGTVPTLPNTSTNGITGTWSPAVVSSTTSGTYTFTPSASQCATTATFTVTVNPNITPTFSFGTSATICAGAAAPALPTTSSNGITGTWSPAVVDNTTSGTYTFTPGAGQCANSATFTVTVNPVVTPTFAFGTSLIICGNGAVPTLPNTSTNGVNGTWNPAVVSNQNSGVYTFTPSGGCASTTTFTVTVNPNITPTFVFGTSVTICNGGTVPTLPNISSNGITGTWSPAVVSNTANGTYTFTPDAGQCAVAATLTVTVNANVTPTFAFGTNMTICSGGTVPTLPTTSSNGFTGTWSPSTVSNTTGGTYTFTPAAGQCATTATFTVSVNPNLTATFSFGTSLTICAGGAVPVLPTTSNNGMTGTWSPAVVSNTSSGTYTFTATSAPCVAPYVYTVTVNPIITPAFPFGTFQSVCIGSIPPLLSTISSNGIAGTWSPSVVDNLATATYTFTPDPGQCTVGTTSFTYEVNPIPSVAKRGDTSVYDGDFIPSYNFIVKGPGADVRWKASDPSIGLPDSGYTRTPSFNGYNRNNNPVTSVVTATPFINGCNGAPETYTITVMPLDKDIFVPNVFSPNADGKNDLLKVYGNYIEKLEMHIFNQWGQQIATIVNTSQGWDGTFKGKPQPVGVYVYALKAVLSGGKTITKKGSITLVR